MTSAPLCSLVHGTAKDCSQMLTIIRVGVTIDAGHDDAVPRPLSLLTVSVGDQSWNLEQNLSNRERWLHQPDPAAGAAGREAPVPKRNRSPGSRRRVRRPPAAVDRPPRGLCCRPGR